MVILVILALGNFSTTLEAEDNLITHMTQDLITLNSVMNETMRSMK